MEFIDLKSQYRQHQAAIDAAIARVLEHGRFIMGPEIPELEQGLAEFVGVSHAITTASGTASLEIALRALDIGPGDEVITVPFTWISTAEVIAAVGATPVFIDIEAASFCMDPTLLEAAITPRTRAIIPVSLFGQMADYDAINAIAQRHNIPVIEDGAQSLGASRHGHQSNSVTTIGCTSFFPAKPLGCYGDGGALFTNDADLAAKMAAIRTHGGAQRHNHPYVGLNGRMDTLQAAILLAKLPHYPDEVEARQEAGRRYQDLLHAHCATPPLLAGNTSVWAQYTLRVANREAVAAHLKAEGIPTAVYYPRCLHQQPAFAHLGYAEDAFPESLRASQEVLSLPMHPYLSAEDQQRIAAALIAAQEAAA
jgi:UDP-2-acetamido-2-deoxy-ribo-hexuluronate aminotransferase